MYQVVLPSSCVGEELQLLVLLLSPRVQTRKAELGVTRGLLCPGAPLVQAGCLGCGMGMAGQSRVMKEEGWC